MDLTRVTRSAIEDNLQNVNLVYFGEEGANLDLIEIIKQAVEDGLSVFKKDVRDNFKSVRHEVQPRKVGIYSTTRDASDPELMSRYATVCITGSPTKYAKVNESTLHVFSDPDLAIDRSIRNTSRTWINVGLEQLSHADILYIPYASMLTVDSRNARSMRDLKRFCSLIGTLAWICQLNRYVYKHRDKTILVASPEDFWNAYEIGSDIFAQSLSGIETRLQHIIDSYQRIVQKQPALIHKFMRDGKDDPRYNNELSWVERSHIQKDIGISSRDTIRRHVKTLEELGIFTSAWTGNQHFIAFKYGSPTNPLTKRRLITVAQNEFYHDLKTKHHTKCYSKLVAQLVGASPEDSSLLKLVSEEKRAATNSRKHTQKDIKTSKKREISRSKLVGNRETKHAGDIKPADVHRYCLANYDDEKTISYKQLKKKFPDQFITGLIESQFLKIQPNGNYQFIEVIANDEI
jgi:hypothetical protein